MQSLQPNKLLIFLRKNTLKTNAREKQLKLDLAWLETQDFDTARPSLFVRFRDYREISPGIWWPFQEDRAQGFPSDNGYQCMRSTYRVQEVRTDVDLQATVRDLQPKEGESVQDQRRNGRGREPASIRGK